MAKNAEKKAERLRAPPVEFVMAYWLTGNPSEAQIQECADDIARVCAMLAQANLEAGNRPNPRRVN